MKQIAMVGALVLLSGTSALAHLKLPPPSPMHPCVSDMKRFCDSVAPGQGRLLGCLDAHKSQLAPNCREELQDVEDAHARVEAIKAKLRAKQIAEGRKPDAILAPAQIGHMLTPSNDMVLHRRPGQPVKTTPAQSKPAQAGQMPSQNKPAQQPAQSGQTPPQNKPSQTNPQPGQPTGH